MSNRLAFVVPAYNERVEDIERSVASIKALDCETHVFVVDDCSATLAPHLPGVSTTRHVQNRGPQGALNTGIAQAMLQFGDVPISRLDVGDIVLPERVLQLEWMLETGSRAVFADHWDRASDSLFSPDEVWDWKIYRDCQFALLSCIWMASVWEEVGGFDADLPYAHDWDYCLKVQARVGWDRYVGGPTVSCGMMPGGYTAQAFMDKSKRRKRDACIAEVCGRARSLRPRGPRLC